MTKFILPLIAAAAVLVPISSAEAGGYRSRHHFRGHHHHHHGYRHYSRPVVVYRSYRPSYYNSYYRPTSYYRSSYDYCAPRVTYRSRPRFSLFLGF